MREQLQSAEANFVWITACFLLHYLDAIITRTASLLMPIGVAVCVINLAIHARRFARSRHNTYGTSARTRAR